MMQIYDPAPEVCLGKKEATENTKTPRPGRSLTGAAFVPRIEQGARKCQDQLSRTQLMKMGWWHGEIDRLLDPPDHVIERNTRPIKLYSAYRCARMLKKRKCKPALARKLLMYSLRVSAPPPLPLDICSDEYQLAPALVCAALPGSLVPPSSQVVRAEDASRAALESAEPYVVTNEDIEWAF